MNADEVNAMRAALLKWRRSLPWVLCLCFVFGCAMAVYTYAYEPDRYQAIYTFYALPEAGESERAPLEASRMLARDCRAYLRTDSFRRAVLGRVRSDGRSYVDVRGMDGTHMLEVTAMGPDRNVVAGLANAAGRELLVRVKDTLGAVSAREIAPASVPAAPAGPNRPLKILWTLFAAFAAGSVLGCVFGSARCPLHFDDPKAMELAVPKLGAVADCRRAIRRLAKEREKKRSGGMLLDHADRLIRENVRAVAVRLRNALCAAGQSVAVIAGMNRETDQAAFAALLCGELARQGFRVLAIDMDVERARLASLIDAHARRPTSLEDYLAGREALADVLMKTPVPTLSFIHGLRPDSSVASVAAAPGFMAFLKSVKSHFDFVILNAAPVKERADAAMLGALDGVTVLTVKDGRFSAQELNCALNDLAEAVKRLKGVVFIMARRARFDTPD